MNTINEMIAYCGVDCGECADIKTGKCPCCRRSVWPEGDECPPVSCCRRKGIICCGDCERFPCKMMKEFYEENRAHYEAYERMEEYRANKRGEITW
ncbi:MAG: DUF3795 domain-containing protein [Solobacterium sp.]|nr:DUF3795 domain-containing protein [Solobacterium sp.]